MNNEDNKSVAIIGMGGMLSSLALAQTLSALKAIPLCAAPIEIVKCAILDPILPSDLGRKSVFIPFVSHGGMSDFVNLGIIDEIKCREPVTSDFINALDIYSPHTLLERLIFDCNSAIDREPVAERITAKNRPDGWYRQFYKRDNRKSFK